MSVNLTPVTLTRDLLAQGQDVALLVKGSSMRPWIRAGDTIFIRKVSIEEIRIGDLVLFKLDKQLVLHRVIRKIFRDGNSWLVIKGDANRHFDPLLQCDQVLGKIFKVAVPQGRVRILDRPWERMKAIGMTVLSRHAKYAYPILLPVWKGTRSLIQPLLRN